MSTQASPPYQASVSLVLTNTLNAQEFRANISRIVIVVVARRTYSLHKCILMHYPVPRDLKTSISFNFYLRLFVRIIPFYFEFQGALFQFWLEKNISGLSFWRPPYLSLGGVPVDQVSTTESLGVYIDQNLSWSPHIEFLTKKIASCIGALKRIRPFLPPETLHFVFNALVRPHFDYCSVVWGNCNMTLSNKPPKLENRAAWILTSSSYDTNVEGLLKKLGWSTQRQMQKAIMVYKLLNGLAPVSERAICQPLWHNWI